VQACVFCWECWGKFSWLHELCAIYGTGGLLSTAHPWLAAVHWLEGGSAGVCVLLIMLGNCVLS
jgi:hypothetical protein